MAAAERGDGAVAVGGRLLEALLRAEIRLRELVRAVIFERGPLDVGFGALHLRRAPIDLRLAWAMIAPWASICRAKRAMVASWVPIRARAASTAFW